MATGGSTTITTVSSLADLQKKTATAMKIAIKRKTEEYDWQDDTPDEVIDASDNEMRVVLDVTPQSDTTAMIPDGGYEAVPTTTPPQHGTFSLVQANTRYSFTIRGQILEKKSRAAYIQKQSLFQATKAVEQFARKFGLQFYGFSTGTKAVVAATGSAGATQTDIQIKNAFGSTLVPGTATADKTYLSSLFRAGDPVALIRSGAIVEFGVVAASPAANAGVGYIDVTFNSSITPTLADLIVAAPTVTDATLTGTDQNRWPIGLLDALTSSSVHGLATSTAPNWAAGYTNTTGGRLSYATLEAMANGLWNKGGVKMDRLVLSQGVLRDVIAGERAAMRYDAASFNLDGEVDKKGVKKYTSQLALPGMAIGWNSQSISKLVLSEKPDYEAGPGIFELDKLQDKSGYVASFNFVWARVVTNRAGLGYASGLTEQ